MLRNLISRMNTAWLVDPIEQMAKVSPPTATIVPTSGSWRKFPTGRRGEERRQAEPKSEPRPERRRSHPPTGLIHLHEGRAHAQVRNGRSERAEGDRDRGCAVVGGSEQAREDQHRHQAQALNEELTCQLPADPDPDEPLHLVEVGILARWRLCTRDLAARHSLNERPRCPASFTRGASTDA
jgi:hypothetical protein